MHERRRHCEFVRKGGWDPWECTGGRFKDRDCEIIRKYGHWPSALAEGILRPLTSAESRFVKADLGQQRAVSQIEKLWIDYKRALRAFEHQGGSEEFYDAWANEIDPGFQRARENYVSYIDGLMDERVDDDEAEELALEPGYCDQYGTPLSEYEPDEGSDVEELSPMNYDEILDDSGPDDRDD